MLGEQMKKAVMIRELVQKSEATGMSRNIIYLSTSEASDFMGNLMAKSSLEHLRTKGDGPAYIKIGRLIKYSVEALQEWMVKRDSYTSTSQYKH